MKLLTHISRELRDRNGLLIVLIFTLAGLGITIEERTIFPIVLLFVLGLFAFCIYAVWAGYKSWRLAAALDKLTPQQRLQILSDIGEEARWNQETKNQIADMLRNRKG